MLENTLRNLETLFLSLLIFLNSFGGSVGGVLENQVVKVVDGDTIEVYLNNKTEKVRLIGLNTPETVDPRKQVECFGVEASDRLKEILHGKIVNLEIDETQDKEDRYGRLLRYVFLDGVNINKKMIEEGYGFEYTYKVPYQYQKEFRKVQEQARNQNLGLWSEENCSY